MDAHLQRKVQRYGWDKAAAFYERYWQEQLVPAQRRLLELAELTPGARVLDVACGTGLVTFSAAEAVGSEGSVMASDLSDVMVAEVAEKARRASFGQVTAARMDAEALQLPDGSFDVVLCALGLMYVPNPLAALLECFRVLRPGGRAVAAVWGAREKCGWAEIFPIMDQRVSSEVCQLFFQLGTTDTLRATMAQAGFTDLSGDRLSTTLLLRISGGGLRRRLRRWSGGVGVLPVRRIDSRRGRARAPRLARVMAHRNALRNSR